MKSLCLDRVGPSFKWSDEEEEGDNSAGRGDAVDVRSAGYVGRYHRERGDSSSSDGEYSHAEVIDRTPSFLSRA